MAGVWKRDGTVAVTNGNKKVTGTGTTFADTKNGVAKGHLFCITSGTSVDFYEVDYVVSNTELYLVQAYRGVTATGKAYEIITTFSDSVPEFARRLTATLSAYQQQSDAFQALLTSTATTVEVTAPDGTKQTLIPWKRVTSEGEGQAARAKTEADKAAASAALAGNIVAASALPLPDVWAPLSDSLRLITGYGREVKVGEDVVARMVNFSRSTTATYIGKDGQLKTAAANEPRFEKEGLLLEGQSTNLVPWSSGYNGETPAWTAANYSMSKRPDGVLITPAVGVAEKCVRVGHNLFPDLPDRPLSITVEVKGNGYDMVVLGFRSTYISALDNGIGVSLVDGTVKRTNHGLTVTRFEPLADGFVRIAVSTPSYTVTTPEWRSLIIGCGSMSEGYKAFSAHDADGVKGVIVRNIQLEALPFASSYIPTNGAAVTRAADVCWIPMAGNSNNRMSFALTISGFKPVGAGTTSRALWYEPDASGPYFGLRYRDGEILAAHGQLATGTAYASGLSGLPAAVIAISPGVKSRAGQYTATQKADSATLQISSGNLHIGSFRTVGQELWGHVRNLRIWHRALTEDQIKAVA